MAVIEAILEFVRAGKESSLVPDFRADAGQCLGCCFQLLSVCQSLSEMNFRSNFKCRKSLQ